MRLEELPEPVAGPGEVLLRVAYNGLCGSDVHEYFDGPAAVTTTPHPLTGCSLPCVLGHELSGLGGRDRSRRRPGAGCARGGRADRGVRGVHACRSSRRHLCRRLAFHGYNRAGGGLAERTVVREDMVHALPAGLSPAQGALVEPMAVARHAVRRSGVAAGETAVVHGAGPIGLGGAGGAAGRGSVGAGGRPGPRRVAAPAVTLGAQHVFDPADDDVVDAVRSLTDGLGADRSIDAAGSDAALAAALRSARPDGVVVVVAHHHQPFPLRSGSLIFNEVSLTGSLIYESADFAWVIDAMTRGRYPTDGWVTTIDFDRVVDDGLLALREQAANKILVDVAGDRP